MDSKGITVIMILFLMLMTCLLKLKWQNLSSLQMQPMMGRKARWQADKVFMTHHGLDSQSHLEFHKSIPQSNITFEERNMAGYHRFIKMLNNWLKEKPKAVIHYLVRNNSRHLKLSIERLEKYFNCHYHYPVVLFHESVGYETVKQAIKGTNQDIILQEIEFKVPAFINRSIPQYVCGKTIGYRHMCRFQAKTIYKQPIMQKIDYALRLDDDSMILGNVTYDIFRYMRDHGKVYGYVKKMHDVKGCVVGLWETSKAFALQRGLLFQWPKHIIYYNNFELSDLSFWRSKAYNEFIDIIDKGGGIYYHRWGDAPIKSIAVHLFVKNQSKIHFFRDIMYKHQRFSSAAVRKNQ